MIEAVAGQPFETIITGFPTGQAGSWSIEVYRASDGAAIVPTSGAGISEPRPDTYRAERVVASAGSFIVRWTTTTGLDPVEDQLVVRAAAVLAPAGAPPYDAATVRSRSALLRERFPADDPYDPETDALAPFVLVAAEQVSQITGRDVGVGEGEAVPARLNGTALMAVSLMTERLTFGGGGDAETSEAEVSGRRKRSESAGPWSVSYFAPGELVMKNGLVSITGNAMLDGLLWALMTDDMRDEWRALVTGVQPPAGVASAFDYRRSGGRYGPYGGQHGLGPDGY